MEIKSTTLHDKERLIRYSDYFAKTRKPYLIVYLALTLWIFILDAYLYLKDALTLELIAMGVLVVIIDLLLVASFWIIPRVTIKKAHNLNAVLSYVFREDGADFTAESAMIKESGSFKYPAIIKVCKNGPDVYLFISKRQAYIVDVSGLSEVELFAFRALVTDHLPDKKIKWK